MADLYEYSSPELIRILGARFKEYRMWANMTQKEVSEQSGVSVITIHKFETDASSNISMSTFLLLLKVIGRINEIDNIMPELPPSPYAMTHDNKIAQRIRHKNIK